MLLDVGAHHTHGEAEIRRLIDRSIGRAIVDPRYASTLLADPTVALAGEGASPQQQLDLRGIRAQSVADFARQAEALFWPSRGQTVSPRHYPLAVAL